jgi:putative phosphoribosyl transferase
MNAKSTPDERYVAVYAGDARLDADLALPRPCIGVVSFAHGSGSNRHSPRNRFVAEMMHQAGLGTLLVSLLTVEEEARDLISGEVRFDIGLLGRRLVGVVDWLHGNEETAHLPQGIFGSSTGAAGALYAAAERPELVMAVVSRGGRPDLAMPVLSRVKASTLLIVGGSDFQVIDMNRRALAGMSARKKMVIVPGATHLFEEPGTLEAAARHAVEWFRQILPDAADSGPV